MFEYKDCKEVKKKIKKFKKHVDIRYFLWYSIKAVARTTAQNIDN